MAGKLAGKVAVITGGNSGIGLAAAKLFCAEGATVVITGRRQGAVDDAVKEIGTNCIGMTSDQSKIKAIRDLYPQIKDAVGNIDVLFLNAGIAKFAPFETVDEVTFDEMINVNLKGVFLGCKYGR